MTDPVEIVRSFYEKLKAGDAAGALGLMAPDIEWITMWHYKVNGPEHVAEGLQAADGGVDYLRSCPHGVHRRRQHRGIARLFHRGAWHDRQACRSSLRARLDRQGGPHNVLSTIHRYAGHRRGTPGMNRPPLPPFAQDTAPQKVRAAEDAWNTRDPATVVLGRRPDDHPGLTELRL